MPDMADWINEQGMYEWDAHERGECDDGCPYCEGDDRALRDIYPATPPRSGGAKEGRHG